jgi:hypothetical protein
MSTNNQIPTDIDAIIERKRAALLEARQKKEEAERLALEQAEAEGKAMFDAHVAQTLPNVPEWMRPYYDPTLGNPDYLRIQKGWDNVEYVTLLFSIPGLTKIEFNPKNNVWCCEVARGGDVHEGWEPCLNMGSDWNVDLEYILARSKKEMQQLEDYRSKYAAGQEERNQARERAAREAEEEKARQREQEARGELAWQKQQAEEDALFDAIKNDPVAIQMLKAFAWLRDERSTFQERLESADWALYNMEERHSRRAEELRRQADEADRRAADERSRLQSDLDDAEAKLKKAQRG